MSRTTIPLAVQMYTLRDVQLPLDEIIQRVAEIGYFGVETFMFDPPDVSAESVRVVLEKYKLQVVSGAVSLDLFENDLEYVIDYHKTLGTDTLLMPWIPEERRATDPAGWIKMGHKLGDIGSRCADAGMRLLYHNHGYELTRLNGRTILEWLLDTANPLHLGIELDLAWAIKADADPINLLHKYEKRCPRVHLRDLVQIGHGLGEADVGDGILDWDTLLPAIRSAKVEYMIVEHDTTPTPIESIQRSYQFLLQKLR